MYIRALKTIQLDSMTSQSDNIYESIVKFVVKHYNIDDNNTNNQSRVPSSLLQTYSSIEKRTLH